MLPIAIEDDVIEMRVDAFEDPQSNREWLAVSYGAFGDSIPRVTVRIHSGCITGDIFGSVRCDCGPQLDFAFRKIVSDGAGCLIYIPGHEGRGIGIVNKIRAYSLQDQGLDTVEANEALGLTVDARSYHGIEEIFTHLGIGSIALLTNNPTKVDQLAMLGIDVKRIEMPVFESPFNSRYLETKRIRMGHIFAGTVGDQRHAADHQVI